MSTIPTPRFDADILLNVARPDFSESYLYAAQSVTAACAMAAVYRAAGYVVIGRTWQAAGPWGAAGYRDAGFI